MPRRNGNSGKRPLKTIWQSRANMHPQTWLNNKYNFMINLIDKYVNPRVNECFKRYNFVKHFLTACRHLVKSCNYNSVDPNQTAEDKALRDKIVMGIRDSVTREALLRLDQPTLDKAIQFCRTSEQSKAQNLQFQQTSGDINFTTMQKKNKTTRYEI